MYDRTIERLDRFREDLTELLSDDHPLKEDIYWVLGVCEALIMVAQLSASEPDYIPPNYDA
jgi:hypothetical protein